ncbi:ABC transporter-associated protein EcsC [Bacillus sp. M6-12]|uniref:EcsC family protein n=1 Tax=Bacillus sp. M6-12 TaxID=2054166 RepID=UPI000C7719ED|nr:EcsC family protein [Bacillus sp. M6-12]PLS17510.1 ABC transporter-associated protein EcsC [Bacillus sp. M6-12]
MEVYEINAYQEVAAWKKKLMKRSGMLSRFSKTTQNKINSVIPEKIHEVITDSIKSMVKTTLAGSNLTTKAKDVSGLTFEQKEREVLKKIEAYQKTATIEGAGTGAGGLLLGLADFPLLISIKMKMLFEIAALYGFNIKDYEERVYLLYVFQLAFSSDEKRIETYRILENWDHEKEQYLEVDWRVFQQEYRDHIDLVKMFQLVPGIGAIVGAYANYNLVQLLGNTAMNCYRMRMLAE